MILNIRVSDNNSHGNCTCKKLHEQTPNSKKKDTQNGVIFWLFSYFYVFYLNIFQVLRSLKTGAQGNCLYRHGLATALALLLTYSYKPV